MFPDTFKSEYWYKLIETKYLKIAQKLKKVYLDKNIQPSNAAFLIRTIIEDIMDIIGEKENQPILLKADASKGIKYNTLNSKIELLKKLNLIDEKLYLNLKILIRQCNLLLYDYNDSYVDDIPCMFLHTIIFIKYFVDKYENSEDFIK